MPNSRLIAVNDTTWTLIPCSGPYGSCTIEEDGLTPQGLEAQFPNDGYVATYNYLAGEQIVINAKGPTGAIGYSAQNTSGGFNYRAADNMCQVKSVAATANVRVVEQESGPDAG